MNTAGKCIWQTEVGGRGALCTEDTQQKQTLNLCCFKIFIYLQDSAVSRCIPGRENICRVLSAPQKCGTGGRKIGGSGLGGVFFVFFSSMLDWSKTVWGRNCRNGLWRGTGFFWGGFFCVFSPCTSSLLSVPLPPTSATTIITSNNPLSAITKTFTARMWLQ